MAVSNTHLVTSPHAIGSRIVRCALIQTGGMMSPADIIQRQVALVKEAAKKGAQVICLQELATGPYFCQVEQREWFSLAEPVPTGNSTQLMMSLAKELGVVIVLPLYENDRGDFYNTAVVIDADGTYVGKYRKIHIPQADNFYEKYYFKPGNTGYPVFQTKFGRIGVYIGPNEFYGQSYFCDPDGVVLAQGSAESEDIVLADLDFSTLQDARLNLNVWRDRRPETYES